jgi:hypothetical protein
VRRRNRAAIRFYAVTALAVASFAIPSTADAQNLFDMLGRIFRGAAPRAYQPEAPRLLESFPEERSPGERASGPGGPSVSYCVRTCDGRYFPLPRNASTDEQALCNSMCPAAQTKIFHGSQIDRAVGNDGKPYASMKNAFLYRDKLVSSCTCNGRDPTGTAALDPLDDPTLRPGDIVVTADGAKVFQGNRSGRKQAEAFVPVSEARNVPKSTKQQLSDLRVATPERLVATSKSGEPAERSVGAPANPQLSMTPDGAQREHGNPPAEGD